jgi:hypothetical protein
VENIPQIERDRLRVWMSRRGLRQPLFGDSLLMAHFNSARAERRWAPFKLSELGYFYE